MAIRREQTEAIRAIRRHEDATADELLALLVDAREQVRGYLEEAGETVTAGVFAALDASVGEAILRVQFGMGRVLQQGAGAAVALGAELGGVAVGGPGWFRLPEEVLRVVTVFHAGLVQDVSDELRFAISRAVQLGALSGASTADVAREIGAAGLKPTGPFKTAAARAETIARTEINRVASMATDLRLRQAGERLPGLQKRWVSARDSRVRPSHVAANGQTVPVEGEFIVGGYRCRYPVDPVLPARESVHCRCRCVAVLPEED